MAICVMQLSSISKNSQARANTSSASVAYQMREGRFEKDDLVHKEASLNDQNVTGKEYRSWLNEYEQNSRSNARIIDKVVVALPREFSSDQQIEVTRNFVNSIGDGKLSNYVFAIHNDKDNNNPHAHISFVGIDKDTGKKIRSLYDRGSAERMRETWANTVNELAKENKIDLLIDHRSYVDQGVDKIPTEHIGWRNNERQTDRIENNNVIQAANRFKSGLDNEEKQIAEKLNHVEDQIRKISIDPRLREMEEYKNTGIKKINDFMPLEKSKAQEMKEAADNIIKLSQAMQTDEMSLSKDDQKEFINNVQYLTVPIKAQEFIKTLAEAEKQIDKKKSKETQKDYENLEKYAKWALKIVSPGGYNHKLLATVFLPGSKYHDSFEESTRRVVAEKLMNVVKNADKSKDMGNKVADSIVQALRESPSVTNHVNRLNEQDKQKQKTKGDDLSR